MLNNIPSIYPWQKWPHRQYLLSQTRARLSLAERGAFADLKDIAATQTPFGSIPSDDSALAGWLMISLKQWLKIKAQVLADWVLDNDRYFLPMLINTACSDQEESYPQVNSLIPSNSMELTTAKTKTKEVSPELSAARSQAAYASHQKRRENKDAKQQNSNLQIANDLQNELQNSNLQISNLAKPLQNGGIKGGDLDLEQDLNKDLVVVNQTVANNQNAHDIAKPATLQQTTKFFMHFDFCVEPHELEPFLTKLQIPMTKHTSQAFGSFVSYYVTKSYQNTREQWIYQYAKWLKREKETPIDNLPPQPTKLAAAFIQPVKPLWETMAEQKAQRQAAPIKDPQQLAAAEQALAQVRKKLGLKAA